MSQTRPNILFILTDQQRWDSVGAYSPHGAATPALDQLAAEGVRFEHAFTCQPVCGPARACLQTGRFASQLGCYANNRALPPGEPTLARWLGAAGYAVGYVGKWHLASTAGTEHNYHYCAIPPERRGGYDGYWMAADLPEYTSSGYAGVLFDQAGQTVPWTGYRADVYTDHALNFLAQQSADQPFFLFLSYVEPHPQPYHKAYQGPPPASRAGIIRDYLRYDAPNDAEPPASPPVVPDDLRATPGDWQEGYADYLACCARVDTNVARLVAHLRASHTLENTVIIYASDHGCHFHTRHQSNDKSSCHDNSIRVPLIIRGPGFTGGQATAALASLIDLPPTVMRCAGLPLPETMMGRPLQEALTGTEVPWPTSVYVQISHAGTGRALRTQDWKYGVMAESPQAVTDGMAASYRESHLYDLHHDPHEANNLVADDSYALVRERLRQDLLAWMVRAGEGCSAILPV
jgi:arylsulfatase A-like enzyme